MNQRATKVGGIRETCGRKESAKRYSDLPTVAEVRALSARLGAHSRRGRCGRPGTAEDPAFWRRVQEKLQAAAKSGRGLHFLSRDELDAVVRHFQTPRRPKKKTLRRRVVPRRGWMP